MLYSMSRVLIVVHQSECARCRIVLETRSGSSEAEWNFWIWNENILPPTHFVRVAALRTHVKQERKHLIPRLAEPNKHKNKQATEQTNKSAQSSL